MTRQRLHLAVFIPLSFCILLILALLSVRLGAKQIAGATIWKAIMHYDAGNSEELIIRTLRLPRALVAVIVGSGFAVSGALMQASTRNPMASPSVLGINAGASLGLALAMAIFPAASFNWTIAASFSGAALTAVLIFGIAAAGKAGRSPLRLALVGTAVTALCNALSHAVASYFDISQELSFWNAGGISGVRPEQLQFILPWAIAGNILALCIAPSVTLLSLGEEVAVGLGGKIKYIKAAAALAVLLLTGSAVAIVGPVSFVGLVVPHSVRYLVGTDYRKVIPASMLSGAILVLLADILSRVVNPPFETPVGAITALIGVPFFIYLATSGKGKNQ